MSFFLGFSFLLMIPSSPFTWTVSGKVSGDSSRAGRGAGGPLALLCLLGEARNQRRSGEKESGLLPCTIAIVRIVYNS